MVTPKHTARSRSLVSGSPPGGPLSILCVSSGGPGTISGALVPVAGGGGGLRCWTSLNSRLPWSGFPCPARLLRGREPGFETEDVAEASIALLAAVVPVFASVFAPKAPGPLGGWASFPGVYGLSQLPLICTLPSASFLLRLIISIFGLTSNAKTGTSQDGDASCCHPLPTERSRGAATVPPPPGDGWGDCAGEAPPGRAGSARPAPRVATSFSLHPSEGSSRFAVTGAGAKPLCPEVVLSCGYTPAGPGWCGRALSSHRVTWAR